MKTSKDNQTLMVLLLCVGFLLAATLACRIPGLGSGDDDPPVVEVFQEAVLEEQEIVPAEPASTIVCYAGINPGSSTQAEVVGILGQPTTSEQEGITTRLIYSAPIAGLDNFIELEMDKVSYTSVVYPQEGRPQLSAVQAQLGQAEHTAYSTYLQGSRAYLYLQQGVLVVGDPVLDVVFIQECFIPQGLNNYLAKYGASLSDSDPFITQETVIEETPMVVDDPVDDPIEDDESVDDEVVLTDRKIYEPMLVYPGTRVIYDSDDLFFGVSATIILAVDAPLGDVVAFYLDGYDEDYLALEPDEAEGIMELVLIKDMFDWRDDEVEAFYRRLIDVEQVEYSLTLLAVMPADEFDKEDFNIMPGETVEAYAPNETLIIFMLSHLENTLEMMDGL